MSLRFFDLLDEVAAEPEEVFLFNPFPPLPFPPLEPWDDDGEDVNEAARDDPTPLPPPFGDVKMQNEQFSEP